MAPKMDQELTSRRRVAWAIVVGILTTAVSGGLLGVATAGDPGADLPDTLTVPEARVGDSGAYDLALVRLTEDGHEVVAEPWTTVQFEWLEPETIRAADGELHRVNRLHYRAYGSPDYNATDEPDEDLIEERDATTGNAVAWTWNGSETRSGTRSYGEVYRDYNLSRSALDRWFLEPTIPGTKTLCGLVTPLPGRTVELEGSLQLLPPGCELLPAHRDPTDESSWKADSGFTVPGPFDPVGAEQVRSHDTVVFRDPENDRFIWLSEDRPYPIRIAVGVDTEDGSDLYYVMNLVSFERGRAPLADGAVGDDADPAPAVQEGRWHPWGPDASDIDHPFTTGDAWEVARDNGTDRGNCSLQSFLRESPEAYVHRARYDERVYDHRRTRDWNLWVTGGNDTLRLRVRRIDEPPTGIWPPLEEAEPPDRETTYHVECRSGEVASVLGSLPPRAPERGPTVASMMARWQAYASDEVASAGANAWSFRVRSCSFTPAEECEVEVKVSAGRVHGSTQGGTIVNVEREDRHEFSLLIVEEGRTTRYIERTSRERSRTTPTADDGPSDPEPNATIDAASMRTPVWSLPPGVAAGVSILGIIAAVLYWAWPVLKHGGVSALYTRIRRPEALDHPVRQAMVDLVRDEPGIHRQEIVRRLDLGKGAARHHLKKLVELDLLSRHDSQGYACYFPAGAIDRRVMAAAPALRSGSARRVLEAIVGEPGLSNGEVAARTGLSPSTVSHHLARLQEADLVRAGGDGRALALAPTEVAERAVDELGL